MTEPVILKKYSNRRLYDTERSAYVTLEQVAEMIKEGRTMKIIDEKTKEDVTGFILSQIMVEESKKNAMWPVSLLHTIIRDSDNVLSEFFGKYLEQTIEVYLNTKKTLDEQFSQWLEMGMDVSEMKKNPFMDMTSISKMFNPFDAGKASQDSDSKKKNEE